LDKTFDFAIKAFRLKNVALVLSTLISLLTFMIFFSMSGSNYQMQSTTATSNAPNESSISDLIQEGHLLLNASRFEEALISYDKVLKIDPRSVDALNGKGLILNQLGKYEEAITWFDKALIIDPDYIDAMYNKADALGELGRYEEAREWTDRALTLKPAIQNNYNSNDLLLPND
jgi:tetratricopeptide (TPR) repeat protein